MPPLGFPAYALVEAYMLTGLAHLALNNQNTTATTAKAALTTTELNRLILPFAIHNTAELLDALPHHQTAHSTLLADIADLLQSTPAPRIDPERLPQSEELSASEL